MLTIWSAGVTFFLTPFLIAKIGTDHYGLFILLMSITGMMGLMNLGLGEATLRFVAYHYGRNDMAGINRVVGATFSIYLLTGVAGWGILFFGASAIAGLLSLQPSELELAVGLLKLTAISFGISFITGAFTSIPQAMQRFDISTKINIAQSVFQIAGTVTILVNGGGIYQLVLWGVVTMLFTQVICVIMAKRLLPALRMRPVPSRDGLKEVFGYGVFALISSAAGVLWSQSDKLLLGGMVNASAVSFLAVPQQLSFRAYGLVVSAGSALLPRFSSMSDKQQIGRLYLDTTWLMLCMSVAICVPLTIVMPDFLSIWISPEFSRQSAWIGQLIACSFMIRGAFVPYDGLLRGLGKPQYLSALSILSGGTIFASNLILIPMLGLHGAGYSYLITPVWGVLTILFTWKLILKMPSSLVLLRIVAVPYAVGGGILASSLLWKPLAGTSTWLGLISQYVGLLAVCGMLLLAVERVLGGREACTTTVTSRLMKALVSSKNS